MYFTVLRGVGGGEVEEASERPREGGPSSSCQLCPADQSQTSTGMGDWACQPGPREGSKGAAPLFLVVHIPSCW